MRIHALNSNAQLVKVAVMNKRYTKLHSLLGAAILLLASACLRAQAPATAVTAFEKDSAATDARIAEELRRPAQLDMRFKHGEMDITDRTPSEMATLDGAMFRHWQGELFVPGAKAQDFLRLMKDFNNYPHIFHGQVVRSTVQSAAGDHYQITMRTRQEYGITVVMDTSFAVDFRSTNAQQGMSLSRSTAVHEIDDAGKKNEHVLDASHDHGFLWRLNTYWTWREENGGLYLRIETLSLSRGIPTGLGWAVGPFVERVPRQSLEFTLRSVSDALKHNK
jgi:hypothetical protein